MVAPWSKNNVNHVLKLRRQYAFGVDRLDHVKSFVKLLERRKTSEFPLICVVHCSPLGSLAVEERF
jgi:hypothetical protein